MNNPLDWNLLTIEKNGRQNLIIANKSSKSILEAVENFKFVEVELGSDEGQLSTTEIIKSRRAHLKEA